MVRSMLGRLKFRLPLRVAVTEDTFQPELRGILDILRLQEALLACLVGYTILWSKCVGGLLRRTEAGPWVPANGRVMKDITRSDAP